MQGNDRIIARNRRKGRFERRNNSKGINMEKLMKMRKKVK